MKRKSYTSKKKNGLKKKVKTMEYGKTYYIDVEKKQTELFEKPKK